MTYQNVRQDLLMEVEINKAYDSTSSSKTEDTAKALATYREKETHSCHHCGFKGHLIEN